jgi:hypothetical protein
MSLNNIYGKIGYCHAYFAFFSSFYIALFVDGFLCSACLFYFSSFDLLEMVKYWRRTLSKIEG